MSEETNKAAEEAENPQDQQPQYTEEQMAEMRNRMKQFYEEEIPYLELQEKYERLQADIEEHKVRRMTMMIRGAQLYAAGEEAEREAVQQQEQPQQPEPQMTATTGGKEKKRSLKTD